MFQNLVSRFYNISKRKISLIYKTPEDFIKKIKKVNDLFKISY